VRVPESELSRACVHHRHEPGLTSFTDVVGERVRGVVGALDQRALQQLADGDPLAGAEVDRGLAYCSSPRGDGDDVVRLRLLDRQEHGHQLRQAGNGNAGALVILRKHLACLSVLDQVGPRMHLWERGEGRQREGRGDSNQRSLHGRKG